MLSSEPETIHFIKKNTILLFIGVTETSMLKKRETYFAARYREIGEYAVLFVAVAGVCLQAFAFAIVPQL